LTTPATRVSVEHPFTRALRGLADVGRSTPCQSDPASWFADQAHRRAEAARACAWCPALQPCATYAAANNERHGVWAGVDRELKRESRLAQDTPHNLGSSHP
jgi:hypothetical protein